MIKMVSIQTRECIEGDAGEVMRGYYKVIGDVLTMYTEDGKSTGKTVKLQPGDDPRLVASRLLRAEMLKQMQRFEIGISIDAKDDCLTVDDEMLLPVLQRSLNDPGVTLCPIVSAAGDQPHPIAIALNTQAVTVTFDIGSCL